MLCVIRYSQKFSFIWSRIQEKWLYRRRNGGYFVTKGYYAFLGLLAIVVGVDVMNVYDMQIISIILGLVICFFLIGGNRSMQRTHSSIDVSNVMHDVNKAGNGPDIVTIFKVIIPVILMYILIFFL